MEKSRQNNATEDEGSARIGSSTVWGVLAKGFSVVANLAIGIIIARALGTHGKGSFAFVQQLVSVLVVVCGLGLATANVYFVASKKVRARDATANSFWLSLIVTLVATVVLYLFLLGPFAGRFSYTPLFLAASVALFLATVLYSWFGAISIGIDGLRVQSISTIVSVVLVAAIVAVMALTGHLSVLTALLAGAIGQLTATIIVLVLERRRMLLGRPRIGELRKMLSYSGRSYLVDLVGFLHLRQDVLILGMMVPLGQVGIYSVAVSFAEIVRYVPSIMNSALFARISRLEQREGFATSALLSRLMVIVIAVIAVVFAGLTPLVLPLMYGSAFARATAVFLVLLPGTVCISLAEIPAAYLFSREIIYWKLSLAMVILNVILNVTLIPLLGVFGAAIASSATYALFAAGIFTMMHRDTGASFKELLIPTRADLKVFFSALRSMLSRKAA